MCKWGLVVGCHFIAEWGSEISKRSIAVQVCSVAHGRTSEEKTKIRQGRSRDWPASLTNIFRIFLDSFPNKSGTFRGCDVVMFVFCGNGEFAEHLAILNIYWRQSGFFFPFSDWRCTIPGGLIVSIVYCDLDFFLYNRTNQFNLCLHVRWNKKTRCVLCYCLNRLLQNRWMRAGKWICWRSQGCKKLRVSHETLFSFDY